ncbi:alpha/beta hydrolase [Streptosporangium sp. NPDC000396]|uniref:alpha/beta hydrolase n=1 Tax=Streptosporangium sp. NPDC000396 TaxID=3366185 RepID=UPI0036BEA62E
MMSILQRVGALIMAPLAAAKLSYLVNHPPRPGAPRNPENSGLTPVELKIPVPGSSGRIHGWLFPGDSGRVVAVGHSIGAEKSRSLPYAKFLAEAGYTVLLFDFRNHGQSFDDGAFSGYSRRFADDLTAVVKHVRAMPGYADSRWALYGLSMSSFAAVHVLSRLDCIEAVVCDSGPTADPGAAVDNLMRIGLLPVPEAMRKGPARAVLETVFRPLTALSMSTPKPWPPVADRPEYDVPMLFIVGDADTVVDPDDVRALAEPFPRSELVLVAGAGHLRAMSTDRAAYQGRVLEFLAKALGEPGSES